MSAPLSNAAIHLPLELWYIALDFTLPSIYDPSNPLHCIIHYQRDWKRQHEAWTKRRTELRLVCQAWNAYLGSTEVLHLDTSEPTANLTRRRVRFLHYGDAVSEASCKAIHEAAPSAVALFLNPQSQDEIIHTIVQGLERDHQRPWEVLSELVQRSSIRSVVSSKHLITELTTNSIVLNFPTLTSLTISTLLPPDSIDHTNVSLNSLRTLELRLSLSKEDNSFPLVHWSLPKLRHLFLGRITKDPVAQRVINFLTSGIGAQLESLEWDAGTTYVDIPNDFFLICPKLHTFITDLSRVGTYAPDRHEGQSLRRIIHTGRLTTNWSGDQLLRWAELQNSTRAVGDYIIPSFTMHSWDSVAAMAFADEDLDESRRTYDLHALEGEFLHTIELARQWRRAGLEIHDRDGQAFDEELEEKWDRKSRKERRDVNRALEDMHLSPAAVLANEA